MQKGAVDLVCLNGAWKSEGFALRFNRWLATLRKLSQNSIFCLHFTHLDL